MSELSALPFSSKQVMSPLPSETGQPQPAICKHQSAKTMTARNLSSVGNSKNNVGMGAVLEQLTAKLVPSAPEQTQCPKLPQQLERVKATDDVINPQPEAKYSGRFTMVNPSYEIVTEHCLSETIHQGNTQTQSVAERGHNVAAHWNGGVIMPERKSLRTKLLSLLTSTSLKQRVADHWRGEVHLLTGKPCKDYPHPSIWKSASKPGQFGVRFPGAPPQIVSNLTQAKKFFANPKNVITSRAETIYPLPASILIHNSVNRITPKLAEKVKNTYHEICSKHPSEDSYTIIGKCKEELEPLGFNKFITIVELFPHQLAIRFQAKFDQALSTGSSLVAHGGSYDHGPSFGFKDKLIDFIANQPPLPVDGDLTHTFALRNENRTISRPFNASDFTSSESAQSKKEVERMNAQNKNVKNTKIPIDHIPPITRSILDGIDENMSKHSEERILSPKAISPEHMEEFESANATMEAEIKTSFNKAKEQSKATTFESYKFLLKEFPALFEIEESLN